MPVSPKIVPQPGRSARPTQTTHPAQSAQTAQTARPASEPGNTDHLVPHANHLLKIAGKAAWGMTKLLVGIAIRIPGWFIRANKRHAAGPRPTDRPTPRP